MPAGAGRGWTVHRLPTPPGISSPATAARWAYDDLRRRLSPRHLALAAERLFRNDDLVVVDDGERVLGIVWRASPARRTLVAGGRETDGAEPVYYHPVPMPGVTLDDLVAAVGRLPDARAGALLVTPTPIRSALVVGRFAGDLRFATRARSVLSPSRLRALDRVDHPSEVGVA